MLGELFLTYLLNTWWMNSHRIHYWFILSFSSDISLFICHSYYILHSLISFFSHFSLFFFFLFLFLFFSQYSMSAVSIPWLWFNWVNSSPTEPFQTGWVSVIGLGKSVQLEKNSVGYHHKSKKKVINMFSHSPPPLYRPQTPLYYFSTSSNAHIRQFDHVSHTFVAQLWPILRPWIPHRKYCNNLRLKFNRSQLKLRNSMQFCPSHRIIITIYRLW